MTHPHPYDESCPHCDVVDIFLQYGRDGWDPHETVELIFQGVVALIAASPDPVRADMMIIISENIFDYVEQARGELIDHNVDHQIQ